MQMTDYLFKTRQMPRGRDESGVTMAVGKWCQSEELNSQGGETKGGVGQKKNLKRNKHNAAKTETRETRTHTVCDVSPERAGSFELGQQQLFLL